MAYSTTPTVLATEVQSTRVWHYRFQLEGRPLSRGGFLQWLKDSHAFRGLLTEIIAACRFEALRFETPVFSRQTAEADFEFVLVNSPGLAPKADPDSFGTHFGSGPVSVFPNLGRDATLVVPTPTGTETDYRHLAAFCRTAPSEQTNALWRQVAIEVLAAMATQPVWLSTAGAGVAWLHVRLGREPKYYAYRDFTLAA